ncbi:MAG: phosphatase PAP2 family protein [Gemmatimonadota bacterium]
MLRRPMDALYAAVRWIRGHIRGFYSAVGVFLVAALGVAIVAAAALALLAEGVVGGATQTFDQAVVDWVRARRTGWLDWLGLAGAALGSGVAAWIVLGLGSLLLWFTRHHLSVAILWIAVLGGRALSTEFKALFDRPRPAPVDWTVEVFGSEIPFPASPSFPSGHAVTSVVVFGTLAYLIARLEPTVRLRRITLATAIAFILLIGLSRVYLGVHYPSDVLAGYFVGFIWATLATFSIEVVRYVADRKPGVVRQEKDLEKGMEPLREAAHHERD